MGAWQTRFPQDSFHQAFSVRASQIDFIVDFLASNLQTEALPKIGRLTMDGPEKIKWVIVEAIGNPDGHSGEWKTITLSRSNAEQIAENIYQALKRPRLFGRKFDLRLGR